MPVPAPDPASPMKWPDPILDANRDAPTCQGTEENDTVYTYGVPINDIGKYELTTRKQPTSSPGRRSYS